MHKHLIFIKSNLSIFSLFFLVFCAKSKNTLPNLRLHGFNHMFSSNSFITLSIIFRSLIHFELIFCSVGSFPYGDYFLTSRISFSCFIRLLHILASTLVFSNQNQKSKTESAPKHQCQWETRSAEESPLPYLL